MTDWYYADAAHTRQGPVSTEVLHRLQQAGDIGSDTLLWRDGLADWQPLHALAHELAWTGSAASARPDAHDAGAASTGSAPSAGIDAWQVDPPAETPAPSGWSTVPGAPPASPYAAPAAQVDRPELVVEGGDVVLAGFRKRLAAYVIDGLIVGIVSMVFAGLTTGVIGGLLAVSGTGGDLGFVMLQVLTQIVSLAIGVAYYAGFHASQSMATPGKMAVGIKVVRLQGARITLARGIGRYFATILSGLILGIGFLMAAFTARKQGLHDMICDTLVVDKWAFTPHPDLQRRELGTVTIVVLVLTGLLWLLGLGFLGILGMAAFAN